MIINTITSTICTIRQIVQISIHIHFYLFYRIFEVIFDYFQCHTVHYFTEVLTLLAYDCCRNRLSEVRNFCFSNRHLRKQTDRQREMEHSFTHSINASQLIIILSFSFLIKKKKSYAVFSIF